MSARTAAGCLSAIQRYRQIIDANLGKLAELEGDRSSSARTMRQRLVATNDELVALIQSLEIEVERAKRNPRR